MCRPAPRVDAAGVTTTTAPLDPSTPGAEPGPHPARAQLRREAPVHSLPLPGGGRVWLVTRHDDVEPALAHPGLSEHDPRSAALPEPLDADIRHQVPAQDPPDPVRLRRLVARASTPRLVASLEPRVRAIAHELFDRVQLQGHLDLVDDYARPLSLTVIAELLGVPAADREPFRRWSYAAAATDGTGGETPERRRAATAEFAAYLGELCARRHREPGDDLVSALVRAAEDGAAVSREELVAVLRLLVVAGHETTVNLIGGGMLALLRHPGRLRLLREDPERLPGVVEELLRPDAPVETSAPRFSTVDVTLPGGTIPAGELVLVAVAPADRDGARPRDPDVRRADPHHLASGHGVHDGLGAPLARTAGHIAIGTLLHRAPGLRPAVRLDALEWWPSLLVRGSRSFPVLFDR